MTENTKTLTAMQTTQQALLAATGQNTTALQSDTATKGTAPSSSSNILSDVTGGLLEDRRSNRCSPA